MKKQPFNLYLQVEEVPRMVEIFLAKGTPLQFGAEEFFLRQGEISSQIGYISAGAFRHWAHATEGRDRIAGYSFEGDFVTDFAAFGGTGSAVSIQAIRESTVYMMEKEEIFGLQTWEYRHKVAELALSDVYGKLLLMHVGTPQERYESLVNHYPAILNEVSLKEIASYLRMTPENLSRVRKKISRK